MDNMRKIRAKTWSFSILVASLALACALNTAESIIDECIDDVILMLIFDSLLVIVELINYILVLIYISCVLEIETSKIKKMVTTMGIFGSICTAIYIIILFVASIRKDVDVVVHMDIGSLVVILMALCFDIKFIYLVIRYSKKKYETTALYFMCGAIVVADSIYMFVNLDLTYLILMIALLICYASIYLKNIYEDKQTKLVGYGVQKSLLPKGCSIYKDKIDFAAKTLYASEVGGNFYDYHKPDENLFSFCIGDSSGTGIPAALRMIEALSLLRGYQSVSINVNGIAQALSYNIRKYNKKGSQHNLWLGMIDFNNSILSYVNAGNCSFDIIRNGKYLDLKSRKSPLIGSLDIRKFRSNQIDLLPKDIIVLSTQGLYKIKDKNGNRISKEKIQNLINEDNLSSKQRIEKVYNYIKEYTTNVSIMHDVTMLILTIKEETVQQINRIVDPNTINSANLKIDCWKKDNALNCKINGSLNSDTANTLNDKLIEAFKNNEVNEIAFDFSETSEITPNGFRPIIKLYNDNNTLDKMYILNSNKEIDKFLNTNSLYSIFEDKDN